MAEKQEIQHILAPKHTKLAEDEVKKVLEKYNISLKQLPKILHKDSAIAHLEIKEGDVIKIIRKSPTAGKSVFYRVVV
ncbi:MAG TPA: DNA-directed RNA polymerase subunit H [Candidatus Nanoarchaeia archaeon]|nr:DNA-directed RNA polymerase subunit H [Candidatus Nanoarchaeia archaeon]